MTKAPVKHRLHPSLADCSDCTLMLQFNISCVDEKYVHLKVTKPVTSVNLQIYVILHICYICILLIYSTVPLELASNVSSVEVNI